VGNGQLAEVGPDAHKTWPAAPPVTAFLLCEFWYIDALATIGRPDATRALFVKLPARRNAVGLPSEDTHPATGALWGNIPQTYSMAGSINSAMRL
jgi:GH15 family glucan-1,4-alpha-glucosidase